jgi:hypothetical protein
MVVRIFPFAPEIPWKISRSFIKPQLTQYLFKTILDKSNSFTIVCYGGLLESYCSLYVAELLYSLSEDIKIYSQGNKQFLQLLYFNGLNINEVPGYIEVPKNLLKKYPTAVFFDSLNNCYFNFLNNFLEKTAIYSMNKFKNNYPIIKQLIENSTQSWNKLLIPKFRNNIENQQLINWKKSNKIKDNHKFVLYIGKTGLSIHKDKFFNWNEQDKNAFAQLIKNKGLNLISIDNSNIFNLSNNYLEAPFSLSTYFYLLQKAYAIISEEPDGIFIGSLLNNNAFLFGPDCYGKWDIDAHYRYTKLPNKKILYPVFDVDFKKPFTANSCFSPLEAYNNLNFYEKEYAK